MAPAHQMYFLLHQSNAERLEEIVMFQSSVLEPQMLALQMANNHPQQFADLEIHLKQHVTLQSTVMVTPTTVPHSSLHPMPLPAMTTQTAPSLAIARTDFASEWILDATESAEMAQLLQANSAMMATQSMEIAVQVNASLKLPAFNAELLPEDAILLNSAMASQDIALWTSIQDAQFVQVTATTALVEDSALQTTTACVLEDSPVQIAPSLFAMSSPTAMDAAHIHSVVGAASLNVAFQETKVSPVLPSKTTTAHAVLPAFKEEPVFVQHASANQGQLDSIVDRSLAAMECPELQPTPFHRLMFATSVEEMEPLAWDAMEFHSVRLSIDAECVEEMEPHAKDVMEFHFLWPDIMRAEFVTSLRQSFQSQALQQTTTQVLMSLQSLLLPLYLQLQIRRLRHQ